MGFCEPVDHSSVTGKRSGGDVMSFWVKNEAPGLGHSALGRGVSITDGWERRKEFAPEVGRGF